MPKKYLRDIADIMAERPILDEDLQAERVKGAWVRRADRDVGQVAVWELPNGEFVGIASPALRARLRRARTLAGAKARRPKPPGRDVT